MKFSNPLHFCLAESSKKQLSRHSVHTTVRSPSEETASVTRTLKPTTAIQSSGLVTRFETKKRNPKKSTISTPKLSSPRTTKSHWLSRHDSTKLCTTSEPMRHTLEPGEWKFASLYYLDQGTSFWNYDDLSERSTSTESGFLTLAASLNIIRSTWYLTENKAKSSVLQNASYNMSHLLYLSTKYTGTLTTTAQDIRASASGVTSPGSANVWSSISTAIRHLSQFEYSKSAGVTNDLLINTKERDRSKLGPTSSSAVTYPWDTSEIVDLTIGGTDMTASRLSPVTKSSPPFPLSDKPSNVTNVVNSLEGSLPGNTFSNEWVFSQSISPKFLDEQYSTMVKETSRVMKSSFSDHSRSPWLMPVSHTPTVAPSIHESVSSARKVHETRQSALPSKLISTESKLVSSGSLRDDFTPVVTIQFPSSPLFTNQGSSADEKAFTPAKGPRSTKQVVLQTEKHSLAISTSPLYNRHYGISTARDVPSLKNTTSLSSLQQTRPSTSQPQSEIKGTLFGSAVILKSNSDTKSSSLSSSRSELSSLPVAMVLSYGSVSPQSSYDNLPTFASEATSHRFSSLIVSQNIVSFIPTSNSKSTLESGKMGTQQWDAPPSTDSVQHPTPKRSVKETNLRAQTTNLTHTYQLISQKGTSTELALSTITSSLITRALSFKQFKTLSQGLLSIAQSLPTGQLTTSRRSSHSEKT